RPESLPAGRKTAKTRRLRLRQRLTQVGTIPGNRVGSMREILQGLAADSEDGNLKYEIRDGVFKSLCIAAEGVSKAAEASGIRKDATIWKLSIDGTGKSATRDYCLAHGEARIGWGKVGDLSSPDLIDQAAYMALGVQDKSTIQDFSVGTDVGDVILCIGSNNSFQAVGVVQGPYRYDPNPPLGVRENYKNVLPVKWLIQGQDINVTEINDGVGFTQKTMYAMRRLIWQDVEALLRRNGAELENAANVPAAPGKKPHVLIIDEINRGNISRIFGDLITLIESSKRRGSKEALEVTLPYSKKKFSVPDNVYLMGTMNTADRSLAGLDVALRRRFVFEEMPPKPELLSTVAGIDLKRLLGIMNQRIEVLLGRDHLLGHAYFIGVESLPALKEVFRRQIVPLLQEYFFENWEKIAMVLNDPRKPKECQFLSKLEFDVHVLFGSEEGVGNGNSRWQINAAAFDKIESYTGIYN
ncbi:MAG: AAA family ATPase, partial [Steroidobacteraceae bacterium]